jgi:hypothetical protein
MRQASNESRINRRLPSDGANGGNDQADGFEHGQQDLRNLLIIHQPSHFARCPGQADG